MSLRVLILLLAATAAGAQPATRAEVAAQRAAIEERMARDKVECEQRFAVAACLDELRQRRQDALTPLVAREHELAAEERRQRALAQAQRVRERETSAAAQDAGPRRERVVAVPSLPASNPPRARSPEQAARIQQEVEQQAELEAAKRREQARARELRQQQRIAAHEAREKGRSKPQAAPLPLPTASATSR